LGASARRIAFRMSGSPASPFRLETPGQSLWGIDTARRSADTGRSDRAHRPYFNATAAAHAATLGELPEAPVGNTGGCWRRTDVQYPFGQPVGSAIDDEAILKRVPSTGVSAIRPAMARRGRLVALVRLQRTAWRTPPANDCAPIPLDSRRERFWFSRSLRDFLGGPARIERATSRSVRTGSGFVQGCLRNPYWWPLGGSGRNTRYSPGSQRPETPTREARCRRGEV
jgi:hypothetical protein